MLKGITIYRETDFLENHEFAKRWISQGKDLGLDMSILIEGNLLYGFLDGKFLVYANNTPLECDFVINRTRNGKLARVLELCGIRVFNSSSVTEIANDKIATHIKVNSMGISSVDSYFFNAQNNKQAFFSDLPVVVKNPYGFGGKNVFLANDLAQIEEMTKKCGDEFLMQKYLPNKTATDIRCYCLGGEIIAAVKRTSSINWRANYKLGGNISLCTLSKKHEKAVRKIINLLKPDYVGIDFLQDEKGEIFFNEIEDVVGSQSLFQLTDLNIVTKYLDYIKGQLQ